MESIQAQMQTVTPYWAREWIKKSKVFHLVKPRVVETIRSEACRKSIIEGWFETWKNEVANEPIYPSMLANFDESMIQPHSNTRVKVVGFKDSNASVVCADPELPHITMGVTIFADGTNAKHLLIYPNKFVPQEARGSNAAQYVNCCFSGQESGWINQDIFAAHCRQIIIPAFLERRRQLAELGVPNAVGVFLVDGHTSRLNSILMEEFRSNNIKVPVLPSHASHVLQPLDLAVFGVFKATISKGDSNLRKLTLPERRSAMMVKAIKSLYLALSPDIILKSFQLSGLHPYDPSIPLKHPCVLLQYDETPIVIDESGKGVVDRYNMSGKVITNLAELEAIRSVEARKAHRKMAKFGPHSTPNDPLLHTNPLSALPTVTNRRGRPRKLKPT